MKGNNMLVQKQIGLLFILLFMLVSCSTRLTSEQRMLWAVNVYNSQYSLYLDQVIDPSIVAEDRAMLKSNPELITLGMINPDLSDAQKRILREKKRILSDAYPIIVLIDDYRNNTESLPSDQEQRLIELLNRLILMVEEY